MQAVKLFIICLTLLLISGCDPNNLLGELTKGKGQCEQAASTISECCARPDLNYAKACRNFAGGVSETTKQTLVDYCENSGGSFLSEIEGTQSISASSALDMDCEDLLKHLDSIWQQTDGDAESTDKDPEIEEDDKDALEEIENETDEEKEPEKEIEKPVCEKEGQTCDDKDPCTINDKCDDSLDCVGEDMDCSDKEDACHNGICKAGKCEAVPLSDHTRCGGEEDTDCSYKECISGKCTPKIEVDETTCDDKNKCTENDKCKSGKCEGVLKICQDSDVCTKDECDEDTGECTFPPAENGTICDDSNACTFSDTCWEGKCSKSAHTKTCSDSKECTDDICNPTSGDCSNPVKDSYCMIQGACKNSGDKHPTTPDCSTCDPTKSKTDWTITSGFCSIDGACKADKTADSQYPVCRNCDVAKSQVEWSTKDNYCFIDNACVTNETANPTETDCQSCDVSKSQTEWSNKPDTTICNDNNKCTIGDFCQSGKCEKHTSVNTCDDMKNCTDDSCEPTDGSCDNEVKNGQCLIENGCYNDHEYKSANDFCQVCEYTIDKENWSLAPNTCFINSECKGKDDTKSVDLACLYCAPDQSTTDWTLKSNYCFIDNNCYYANDVKSQNENCLICDPTKSTNSWTIKSNTCHIGSACYVKDQIKSQEESCQFCKPDVANTAWSLKADYCYVQNTCVPDQQIKSDDEPCQICDVSKSTEAYVDANLGFNCEDGNKCTSNSTCKDGQCTEHGSIETCEDNRTCTSDSCDPSTGSCKNDIKENTCLISGSCYGDQDFKSTNQQCQICDAGDDNQNWTTKDNTCFISGACYNPGDAQSPTKFCKVCSPTENQNDFVVADTSCFIGGICKNENDVKSGSETCMKCLSTKSQDDWSLIDNACYISTVCYNATETKVGADCLACEPASTTSSWSIKDETCYIEGSCYDKDITMPPSNTCMSCKPQTTNTGWTQASNTCFIENACYNDQQASSADECQYCNVAMTTSEWTLKGDTTPCNDQNDCTSNSTCSGGTCSEHGYIKECTPPGICWVSQCMPSGGQCTSDRYVKNNQSCAEEFSVPCIDTGECYNGDCIGFELQCAPDATEKPLTDAGTGLLSFQLRVKDDGDASPVCVTTTVEAQVGQTISLTLTSPSSTEATIYTDSALSAKTQIIKQLPDYGTESRKGLWTVNYLVSPLSPKGTMTEFKMHFGACPTEDGDVETEEADTDIESEVDPELELEPETDLEEEADTDIILPDGEF